MFCQCCLACNSIVAGMFFWGEVRGGGGVSHMAFEQMYSVRFVEMVVV